MEEMNLIFFLNFLARNLFDVEYLMNHVKWKEFFAI